LIKQVYYIEFMHLTLNKRTLKSWLYYLRLD